MSQNRQLAAIMFTDIVGYTALMGKDEKKAFELLEKNRQVQKPIIEAFKGRWIKELGDGVLASFTTLSDAVQAAIRIQQKCNASKEFQLRIGIHLGEVVFEGDDVFGDGVNIASRIQAIANPGSIFISETVSNSLSNKREFQTKFYREARLKNVIKPIKVYQLIADGVTTAPMHFSQKIKPKSGISLLIISILLLVGAVYIALNLIPGEKPFVEEKSIAILPFMDLSPEKNLEYLSEGLADEIINSISIIRELKVIGRTSSFQFKGKAFDAKIIGEKLNVNNVMEGSIQRAGNLLRITVNLVRVKDNAVIWSQRFDNRPKDIFATQDSIAKNIVDKLHLTLSESEKPRLVKKETDPAVYEEFLKGLFIYKKNNYEKSIEYNLRAISMDSLFAPAYAYIALAKIWMINNTGSFADYNAIREAKEYAYHAIRLDPDLAEGYSALALSAWTIELDFPASKINFEKSIQLNPSASLIKNRYGYFLLWMGEFDKAEKMAKDATRSDPADYNGYTILAVANMYKRSFHDAEKYLNEGEKLFPERKVFKFLKIDNYFLAGKYDEVIQATELILKQDSSAVPENLLAELCVSYHKKNNMAASQKIIRQLNDSAQKPNTNSYYNLARINAQLQNKDLCFANLEKAFAKREKDLKLLKIDALLDPIKTDLRYKDFYRRYGFERYK